jgi:predicted nicotinamide N-methyase
LSDRYTEFILGNTARTQAPLVPEITLHLASEVTPLWHATEEVLARNGLPPPYWAFAWRGQGRRQRNRRFRDGRHRAQ